MAKFTFELDSHELQMMLGLLAEAARALRQPPCPLSGGVVSGAMGIKVGDLPDFLKEVFRQTDKNKGGK